MSHSSDVLTTQLTAVLHPGYRVSCHTFLSLCLCFNRRPESGRSLFKFEGVTLLSPVYTPKLTDCKGFYETLNQRQGFETVSISKFFNRLLNISRCNVTQYVENDW
jgi:hypothetical protein